MRACGGPPAARRRLPAAPRRHRRGWPEHRLLHENRRRRRGGRQAAMPGSGTGSRAFLSLGGALIALLALGLARLLFAAPQGTTQPGCSGLAPFVVSLPAGLPPPRAAAATPAVGDAG